MLRLRLAGSALVDVSALIPEITELAVLIALCVGMGTGPLRAVGVRGSIALDFVGLDWTEEKKDTVKWKYTLIHTTQDCLKRGSIFLGFIFNSAKTTYVILSLNLWCYVNLIPYFNLSKCKYEQIYE